MTLEELNEMWEVDCTINDDRLDKESVRTPNLHAKYLRLLMQHKMKMAALDNEYKTLRQRKFRYYRGEMPKDELNDLGWSQWQGVKPLKNELDQFLQGDADLIKITAKIDYINILIQAFELILKQISARDWSIRNAIEFKKFIAGG